MFDFFVQFIILVVMTQGFFSAQNVCSCILNIYSCILDISGVILVCILLVLGNVFRSFVEGSMYHIMYAESNSFNAKNLNNVCWFVKLCECERKWKLTIVQKSSRIRRWGYSYLLVHLLSILHYISQGNVLLPVYLKIFPYSTYRATAKHSDFLPWPDIRVWVLRHYKTTNFTTLIIPNITQNNTCL